MHTISIKYSNIFTNRIAYGEKAKLLPHHDPTDNFFGGSKNSGKTKKESDTEKNMTNKKKRKSTNDGFQESSTKRHFTRESQNRIDYIKRQGFQMENSMPDGNCFFHTIGFLTKEPNNILRQSIVTKMRIQRDLYKELFTDQLKMKYFVNESSLEERCQKMLVDKTWAGFPEKITASHFIGKNIYELYQQNHSFHWNVFLGTMDPRILEQNMLKSVFIHYDSVSRHFSPLTPQDRFPEKIRITNIYCLLAGDKGNDAVFIHLSPEDLNPNHEMFQNWQNTRSTNEPVGLMNMGNTCYFSALIQSLYALPAFVSAINIDKTDIGYEQSFVENISKLLEAVDKKESLINLKTYTMRVLENIRKRFNGQFLPGDQADPQELLIHIKMMMNEELRTSNEVTFFRNYPNLLDTIESFENCNKSKTTKLTTIYTKVIRTMHSTCMTESFEALPFLVLQFNGINSKETSTTVESLLDTYVQKKNSDEILRCPSCNLPKVDMNQETLFAHLPEILILTVERYHKTYFNLILY